MENQFCPKCGTQVENGSAFCARCGSKIGEKIFCRECGAEIKPGSAFCQTCGAPLTKTAEKTLKTAVKETTTASNPIILKGSQRTASRKISDMLMFFATIILILVPFVSFISLTGTGAYREGFVLFGNYVQYPTGYLWGAISLLSSLDYLSSLASNDPAAALSILFAIFFTLYLLVLQIVSIVAFIKTIVKFCKGESYDITKRTLKIFGRTLLFFIFASLFSTNALSINISGAMKLAIFVASVLIIGAAVLSFISNRRNIFVSYKEGYGAMGMLIFFSISLLCALLLIGFKSFNYLGLILQAIEYSTNELILMAAVIAFPTFILSFILLIKNFKNFKESFKSAVYLNYTSREEKAFHNSVSIYSFNPVAFLVLSTITLAFSTSLTLIVFTDYLDAQGISIAAKYILLPFAIWTLALVNVIATGVCKSLAKKKIENAKSEFASEAPLTAEAVEDMPVIE